MRLTNNTINSIDNWFTEGLLPINYQSDCDQCELLRMEVKRLKWLIQNMITAVEDIEEFNDGANNT